MAGFEDARQPLTKECKKLSRSWKRQGIDSPLQLSKRNAAPPTLRSFSGTLLNF